MLTKAKKRLLPVDENDLSIRFYDLKVVIEVRVDAYEYIHEIKAAGPYRGYASIRSIVNMLERDLNVIVKDDDLVKLRNSIVYYNEYFCKSEDGKKHGYKPAYMAQDRICHKFDIMMQRQGVIIDDDNPFTYDPLGEDSDCDEDRLDNVLKQYMDQRREERKSIITKNGSMSKQEYNNIEPVIKRGVTYPQIYKCIQATIPEVLVSGPDPYLDYFDEFYGEDL